VTYDELIATLDRILVDIEFARIWREESKRTIICRPEHATELRWRIDQAGLDDVLKIVEQSFVPEGTIWIIDEQAIEAGTRQALAKPPVLFGYRPALYYRPPGHVPPPIDPRAFFLITGC